MPWLPLPPGRNNLKVELQPNRPRAALESTLQRVPARPEGAKCLTLSGKQFMLRPEFMRRSGLHPAKVRLANEGWELNLP